MRKENSYSGGAGSFVDDGPSGNYYRAASIPRVRAGAPVEWEDIAPGGEYEPEDRSRSLGGAGDGPRPERNSADAAAVRARRRPPIRRKGLAGGLPESLAGRIAMGAIAAVTVAALVYLGVQVDQFLRHDPRFRIENSADIQIIGNSRVTRPELLATFGADIGRNIFFVPLAERRADLEKLPWVQSATVMRLLPNDLRVSIVERVPVAFVKHGRGIGLVDGNGVLLDMPHAGDTNAAQQQYSFPVVTGVVAEDSPAERAERMRLFRSFIAGIDSGTEKVSPLLSEVDLSDVEDVKAEFPESGRSVLVHFGNANYLERYTAYKAHLAEWLQQYPRLSSVDMRYERQVVLEMDKGAGTVASNSGDPVTPKADSIDGGTPSGVAETTAARTQPDASTLPTSQNRDVAHPHSRMVKTKAHPVPHRVAKKRYSDTAVWVKGAHVNDVVKDQARTQ